MKHVRLLLPLVILALSSAVSAQSQPPKPMDHGATQPAATQAKPAPSPAKQAFTRLKSLAGVWQGKVETTPPTEEMKDVIMTVTLRVTSMGNALLHEMTNPKRPDDPITMLYLDKNPEQDRLLLTHYCDAGNRPRMLATAPLDGKTVQFDFLDIAGDPKYHMHNAAFTFVDADRHIEDWTFMVGDKPVRVHLELTRKNDQTPAAGQ